MIQTEKQLKYLHYLLGNLDKYKYLTDEDLALKSSTAEPAKFEYSPLSKIFHKGLDKKEDKKERFLRRLKNTEANQNSNNNDKSSLASARRESSTKTSISDDEKQTSFEYLKNNRDDFFFLGYSSIFY